MVLMRRNLRGARAVAHSAPPPVSPMDGARAGKSKGEQQIIQKVGRIAHATGVYDFADIGLVSLSSDSQAG